MDLNLKNKVIIVTGGARGIGEGIVRVLAAEGAVAVVVGRNKEDNKKLCNELEGEHEIFSVTAELSKPDENQKAVDAVIKKYDCIDGLINNAGKNDGVGLEYGDYAKFMNSLHNNLVHYYFMTQCALAALKKSKGSIVNITSKTAETGQGNTSAYAASNGGRNALTREWAIELLKYGIRVNAVVVAECRTPQYEKWIKTFSDPHAKLRDIESRIPLGHRMTTPEEIANMTVFLLSEQSSHTTGQLIHVDGGYIHLDRALL